MQTEFCKKLGIDVPIFAFTHCRDVVVAVSKAGGIGVLGAVGFSPEQLKEELDWIDAHIGDHIYGVDTAIPQKYEGMEKTSAAELVEMLNAAIPQEHRDFAEKLLSDAGVPEWPDKDDDVTLSFSALTSLVFFLHWFSHSLLSFSLSFPLQPRLFSCIYSSILSC